MTRWLAYRPPQFLSTLSAEVKSYLETQDDDRIAFVKDDGDWARAFAQGTTGSPSVQRHPFAAVKWEIASTAGAARGPK